MSHVKILLGAPRKRAYRDEETKGRKKARIKRLDKVLVEKDLVEEGRYRESGNKRTNHGAITKEIPRAKAGRKRKVPFVARAWKNDRGQL